MYLDFRIVDGASDGVFFGGFFQQMESFWHIHLHKIQFSWDAWNLDQNNSYNYVGID